MFLLRFDVSMETIQLRSDNVYINLYIVPFLSIMQI